MGRPLGAVNKHRPFKAALLRAVEKAEQTGGPIALDKLAESLLSKAAHGDLVAMKEVADRLDGKVPNVIGGDSETDPIQIKGIAWLPSTGTESSE